MCDLGIGRGPLQSRFVVSVPTGVETRAILARRERRLKAYHNHTNTYLNLLTQLYLWRDMAYTVLMHRKTHGNQSNSR